MTKKNKENPFLIYSGMGIQMIVIIVAGVYLGKFIDEKMENETIWFTLFFSLLAVGIAIYTALKDLINPNK
ncbi:MAG: AtpZ/AtpI family protein [Flavobacteriales bacterium]